jgi:hypothetical protein
MSRTARDYEGLPASFAALCRPSGVNVAEKFEQTPRELAPNGEIAFRSLAMDSEQIAEWDLPTRPTKASGELDAIEPNRVRSLLQETLEEHLPAAQLRILKASPCWLKGSRQDDPLHQVPRRKEYAQGLCRPQTHIGRHRPVIRRIHLAPAPGRKWGR